MSASSAPVGFHPAKTMLMRCDLVRCFTSCASFSLKYWRGFEFVNDAMPV